MTNNELRDSIRKGLYLDYGVNLSNRGVRELCLDVITHFEKKELNIYQIYTWANGSTDLLAAYYFGKISI
jgi:hypothetical protein